jgi:hypothetical protein
MEECTVSIFKVEVRNYVDGFARKGGHRSLGGREQAEAER